MKRKTYRLVVCLCAFFILSGCATALVVGTAAIGAGAGTYFYVNGELKTDYAAPFEQVWAACEKTVADMRGTEVKPAKEIAQGKISALINDEKVHISVTYRGKNQTSVAIRVGIFGNQLSSQRIHDKISSYLSDV